MALHPESKELESIDHTLLPTYQELQIHGQVIFSRDIQHVIVCDKDITEATRPLLEEFHDKFAVPLYRLTKTGMLPL